MSCILNSETIGLDELCKSLANKSLIIGVFGVRGSGKTSKGFSILDMCHSSGRPTFIMRFPRDKAHLLSSYIKIIDRIEEAPKRACILIDEASLFYYSKESMRRASKILSRMMITARHRDQTLIFTTVTATSIDLDIIRLLDVILYCKPSKFSEMFEREKLRWVAERARKEFEKKLDGDPRSYAYVWSEEGEAMIKFAPPVYWSEGLSKYLGDITITEEEEAKKERAKTVKLKLPRRYLHILKAISKGYKKPDEIKRYYNLNGDSLKRLLDEMVTEGLIVKPHLWSGYETTAKSLDFLDLRSTPRKKKKRR